MNHFLKYSFSIFCLLACSACDDDGIGVLDIEIPEGYALSAGTSTIFLSSSVAYDTPADWITGAYDVRFTRGYMTMYVQATTGMVAVSDLFMPVTRAAAATGMQGALNPLYGQRADRAAMVSPPCWFTYPVRTELSFRIMDVCFMISLSRA